MLKKQLLIAVAILALVTMACGFSFNIPEIPLSDITTGATVTEDINVPLPEDEDEEVKLSLGFGAGKLRIEPGAQDAVIAGTVTYNVADFKPEVSAVGNEVRLETGDLEIDGIPIFDDNFKNEWDLQIGDVPIDLTINAGAYEGRYDLGGLSLQSLQVDDGAADVRLSFSELNKTEMESLRYSTGASSVKLTDLANANFERMVFKGGAGEYTLDFSGDLQRDATVTIDAGVSSITVIVPRGVSASVFVDGGLTNFDVSGDWDKSGDDYSQAGVGPRITINVNIGAGNLELRN